MGPITVSRFFGGAALRAGGVQFAFVMRGSLYLRVDADGRASLAALGAAPFSYAGRSATVTVASYIEAPDQIVADPDELLRWARRAQRVALATRKATTRRRGSKRARASGSAPPHRSTAGT
jgi:TfoX/Sxy family transcriptional regulator of competence genes